MSDDLFRRTWKVIVDTLDLSNLDIEFKVRASLKSVPNTCELTIWNANQDHRAQILKRNRPNPTGKLVGVPVQIEAGLGDLSTVIFSGDLREVVSQRDPTDWKTKLAGDDGGRSYREARINTTFTQGTSVGRILEQCASAMGIGLGNASDFTATAEIAGLGSAIPHTMVCSGSAQQTLTRVLSSIGLTWSIQRGALQVMQRGVPLAVSAALLSPSTGLIGSPEAAVDASVSLGNPQQFAAAALSKTAKAPKPKDPSILKGRAMIIPGLVPGRKIVLDSDAFKGGYQLMECEYVGQSWAPEQWLVNWIARAY